ncbi:hypothetical protein TNCV_394191 [Trichonephila clavipes]|nr:hypothetical protein TNCV_394191 [Trichonephila clavipes]
MMFCDPCWKNNPHLTSREIAEEFAIHHATVGDYIKSLGTSVVVHNTTVSILSPQRRRLWFCVKGRERNGRLADRPLCCKRRRMTNASIGGYHSYGLARILTELESNRASVG